MGARGLVSMLAGAATLSCGSCGHDGVPPGRAPVASDSGERADAATGDSGTTEVIVFSRTLGFRHSSIPNAIAAIADIGRERNWTVTATEDPAALVAALPRVSVVVFA